MKAKDEKELNKIRESLETEVITGLQTFQGVAETVENLAGKIGDAKSQVEAIRDALQEKFDSLSEKAQEGEKGQELSGQKDILDEVVTYLEEAETAIQEEGLAELSVTELGDRAGEITEQLESAVEKLGEL
jgi:flagellar hook-basal body complex protein FliE